MSINIWIEGNDEYCKEHGLVGKKTYECMCSWDSEADPRCLECKGTGEVSFDVYPFMVNMTNSNWAAFHKALGLYGDVEYGSVAPQDFQVALARPALKHLQYMALDYIGTRIVEMLKIAEEAEKRQKMIHWG